jgi:hypothetical protein
LPLRPTDNAAMEAEPIKAEPSKRKRRWFQFSLRTMLIMVALLAVPLGYFGWQAKIVRERKDLLSLVVDRGGGYLISDEPTLSRVRTVGALFREELGGPNRLFVLVSAHDVSKNPSRIRNWFGDESITMLWLTASIPSDEAAKFIAAFPEANVCQLVR